MDDLISRQAALYTLCHIDEYNALSVAAIRNLPPAQPERKKGKWQDGHRMSYDGTFYWFRECSECGYEREDDNEEKDTPYCPKCGAKMDGGRTDE